MASQTQAPTIDPDLHSERDDSCGKTPKSYDLSQKGSSPGVGDAEVSLGEDETYELVCRGDLTKTFDSDLADTPDPSVHGGCGQDMSPDKANDEVKSLTADTPDISQAPSVKSDSENPQTDLLLVLPVYNHTKRLTEFHLKHQLRAESNAGLSNNAIGRIAQTLAPAYQTSINIRSAAGLTAATTTDERERSWRCLLSDDIVKGFTNRPRITLRDGVPLEVGVCESANDPTWTDPSNVEVPLSSGINAPKVHLKTWVNDHGRGHLKIDFYPSSSDVRVLHRAVRFSQSHADLDNEYPSIQRPTWEGLFEVFTKQKVPWPETTERWDELNAFDRDTAQLERGEELRRLVEIAYRDLRETEALSKLEVEVTDITKHHLGATYRL